MGSVPTQTLIHSLTDKVTAILQKDVAGFDAELSGATVASLWDLLDAAGDPDVETALGAACLAVDRQSLPANYATAIKAILGRTKIDALLTAINSLVVTGGGYASFQAYLSAKSATVSALFAEAWRHKYGQAAFGTSTITEALAPLYQVRAAARIYTGADGALVDDTTDAGDVGTADVALFATDDFCLYVGSPYKFTQIISGLSTLASGTITPTFQYWNGSAWTTLTATDNGVGFTKNDSITWTAPDDWEPCYKDAGATAFADTTRMYYVRISRTANVLVTPPVASTIRIVPDPVYLENSTSLHLGVDQPPLGILRITGTDTIVAASVVSADYSRFLAPAIQLVALTPFASDLTITISYTNQTGSNVTQAQSAWSAPIAALDTKAITLNGADTGVRTVRATGWAVTTAATEGVIAVHSISPRTPAL